MNVRIIISSLLFIFIYNGLLFYIGWNGWVWLQHFFTINLFVYTLVIIALGYSYILSRFIEMSFLKLIGSCWFAVMQYALLLLPIANLAVWLMGMIGVDREMSIIGTGWVTVLVFIFIFAYGLFNAYSPVIRRYQIEIPKKVSKQKMMKIVVASDMHFGTLSGKAHLNRLVTLVNGLRPDLILLPGDIIDDNPKPFIKKKMDDKMRELTAPLGVYGVLGNHEYYGGQIPWFTKIMNEIDIRILQDEIINIEGMCYLVGRKDKTDKRRKTIKELVKELNDELPIIMMDHQPYQLEEAMTNQVDIIVSGHTHRGQMAPNHLITKRMYELDWGYKKKDQLHAFVSSGFGFWGPPIRLGSRSEIVVIDLTFTGE
ncbi:metallophosphoesterase [Halalkalibacter alkalisediminis]|uniref:Metallophosphoesterase n=1 Tax=Halalkalibacter alkalisediminis TaxID=935616 RepID=A0ABV6NBR6_9BACI|nr:metallophosphoesterase [Halalkalibacter alkalisediminis]